MITSPAAKSFGFQTAYFPVPILFCNHLPPYPINVIFWHSTCLYLKRHRALTSWYREADHHYWRCEGWQLPSLASQLIGSSPPSYPGWRPGWACEAVVRRSVTAEGCWMFSATCCCCCGRGTCIQRSHYHCCCLCSPLQAFDRALNSLWRGETTFDKGLKRSVTSNLGFVTF